MSSEHPSPEGPESGGRPPRNPMGMGAPIALIIIASVIIGGLLGQPSIGFLVGIGLGILIAVINRRK